MKDDREAFAAAQSVGAADRGGALVETVSELNKVVADQLANQVQPMPRQLRIAPPR